MSLERQVYITGGVICGCESKSTNEGEFNKIMERVSKDYCAYSERQISEKCR
ncbi:Uncharacterised protein [uncultured archaeon]|nr:Uncharacterised protein [uncultured archaeon]